MSVIRHTTEGKRTFLVLIETEDASSWASALLAQSRFSHIFAIHSPEARARLFHHYSNISFIPGTLGLRDLCRFNFRRDDDVLICLDGSYPEPDGLKELQATRNGRISLVSPRELRELCASPFLLL